ncbi:phosphoribosylglycinamide formyltransferase [Hoyosella rhizosphaerae]|uniref:Phosphoribosylglycinamide formyltransferase n=2 Tax=Hoyosella rhizosphaerae TaxID=1755582 RepID=A0A916XAX3_9ACTN|nr:phosphoribosylglycinamide formyltransferase [Hoyosella rhizosphaerae]
MYTDDDPYLAEIRRIALGFPEATEVEAWGRPTFRAKKMFGIYSGSMSQRLSLEFLPDHGELEALRQDPRFYVPQYSGAFGWLALDLTAEEPDLAEIAELLESSFRRVAFKRMIAALDASPRTP